MKGRVFVDIEKCVACKRCVLGCYVEHSESKDLFGAMTEVPAPRSRVRVNPIEGSPVPTECRHCDAAACVAACPTGALYKTSADGPVLLKEARCVGCASCVVACPYGVVRRRSPSDIVYKCDLCIQRPANDQVPACVESCHTGCLSFKSTGEMKGFIKKSGGTEAAYSRTFAVLNEAGEGGLAPPERAGGPGGKSGVASPGRVEGTR